MRFCVLGPIEVTDDSRELNIGGPKQQAVLAMLIAHAGHQISASTLVTAAYGVDAAPNAKRRIQVYISTLRGEIGDRIKKVGQGWKLDVADDDVDAGQFERLLRAGRDLVDTSPESAAEVLRDGLALWRGRPYAGIEANGELEGEIRRLDQLRLAAQEARIDADLALGHHSELIGELEALVIEHPFVESFRARHMLALYRAGRQREALRSYEQMRMVLVDELGVSPTPDLQDLEQKILQQDESLRAEPPRSISRRAIVVADAGNPLDLARLPAGERDDALAAVASTLDGSVAGTDTEWIPSGLASYAVVDTVEAAMAITRRLVSGHGMVRVRVAIDHGEVELGDGLVTGAPVSRGAILAAAAHPGQVLLSSEAQHAFVSEGAGHGVRFELLGSFDFPGIAAAVPVYQLLTADPPREFPPLVTDRPPARLPGGGHPSVPGYELREPLGIGSIGTLHRAYQPTVGREVLVEVIGRAESSGADFIRRFEVDAQRLALLEHPNINPLIDYWRDVDGAYLVYHLHRGGSLATTGVADGRRLVEQVGSALDYAHSYGLVHGSLRPDRVMLDESGNGYLMSFQLAGVAPRSSPDHPAYITPESLAGEAPTVASDIYALGVLAHELESGSAEGDQPMTPATPAVARAIAEAPEDRYGSVAEFVRAWSPRSDRPDERFTRARNPYKGLAAFHEADAEDFFGRDPLVKELIAAVASRRFVAVVGPSGVGKSSAVRAGLVPQLRRGAVEGSEHWVITDMVPGPRPFIELERALERVAVDLPARIRERFADRDPNALSGVVAALPDESDLVVVIDQFEELFTMTDEHTAAAFLDLLGSATTSDARFIVTLRADFLDRPLLYPEFGDLLRSSMVTVRAPYRSELAAAVQEPARRLGVDFDAAAMERIVADVHEEPGALPLLQHALVELFDQRSSDLIGPDDYERIGGVAGALARRAESIYSSLDEPTKAATEQLFLRLVTVADTAAATRRRARVIDLRQIHADEAIDVFVRHRLLVFDNDPDTHTPTVEVAHEALFTHWPRLAGWIDAARDDLALARRLDEAVRDWEANERADTYLLTAGRLAQHEAWTATTPLVLTEHELDFLRESAERDLRLTRQRRRRRNWITGAVAIAAVVALVFGLVAQREAGRADESAELARARELATSAEAALETDPELSVLLAVEATDLRPESRITRSALNRALQAHRATFRIDGTSVGSVSPDGSLLAAATSDQVSLWDTTSTDGQALWSWDVWDDHQIGETYFSTDGRTIIVVSFVAGGVCAWDRFTLFDAGSGNMIADRDLTDLNTYYGGPAQNGPFVDLDRPIVLGPGGTTTACDSNPTSGELVAVDLLTGEQTGLGEGASPKGRNWVGMPTLSTDGTVFATTGFDGGAVVDLETGDEMMRLPSGLSTLNADGTLVLTGNDPVELWDVARAEKLREFKELFGSAWFSPTGSMVYGSTADGRVVVYDTQSGDLMYELRGQGAAAVRVQMTDDEHRISADGSVIWDIGASPTRSTAGSVEFSADLGEESAFFVIVESFVTDEHLVTLRAVSFDDRAGSESVPFADVYDETTVYDLTTGEVVASYPGSLLAVAPDGDTVAVQRSGPLTELTDADTGGQAPPGVYLPTEGVYIADLVTGRPVQELEGLCRWYSGPPASSDYVETDGCVGYPGPWRDYVNNARFSADGSMLAMAGQTGRFAVWDVDTGDMIWSQDAPGGIERAMTFSDATVSFSPDGKLLLTSVFTDADGLDGPATIQVRTVGELDTVVAEFETNVGGPSKMEFTPDGSHVVLNDQGLDVIVVETENWERVHTLSGQHGSIFPDIALDPTGHLVATAGDDGVSVVWDVDTGEEVQRFVVPGGSFGLRNVEWVDERTLVLGTRQWASLMTLDARALTDVARHRLTRTFTPSECSTYDIDPCPSLAELRAG